MTGKAIWIVFNRHGEARTTFKEVIGPKAVLQKDQSDSPEEEK